MSKEYEERILTNKSLKNNPKQFQNIDNDSSKKEDYCNLNIATFTFGGKLNNVTESDNIINTESSSDQNLYNQYKKNNTVKKISQTCSQNVTSSCGIINKIGQHNSFLSVIVHTIYHMQHYKNFMLNEIAINNERDKLLYHLKSTLIKYSSNKTIDINKLRVCLAENFASRRKFILDQPDDPVDCYYAFINALHCNNIVIIFY